MSSAPIILQEYDPTWPSKFKEEKEFLLAVAGQWFYGSIEHVGSYMGQYSCEK